MKKLLLLASMGIMLFALGCRAYEPGYDYDDNRGRTVIVDPENKRKALPPEHQRPHHRPEHRPEHQKPEHHSGHQRPEHQKPEHKNPEHRPEHKKSEHQKPEHRPEHKKSEHRPHQAPSKSSIEEKENIIVY